MGTINELKVKTKTAFRILKSYPISAYEARRNKGKFSDLKRYCMFIGYPRSGHSLVGSLVDAHPNAIISHELDILLYFKLGFGKNQLLSIILENSQQYAREGRANTGYPYMVPNQWQGKFRKLEVIGDKYGDLSTRRILEDPTLLDRFTNKMGLEMKFIHVIRNPYDIISTWAKRRKTSISEIIPQYFKLAEGNAWLKRRLGKDVLDVRHEALIEDPKKELRKTCEFLDLDATKDYLEDCASIIYKKPHKSRKEAPWTPELIEEVRERMEKYQFFSDYEY